MLGSPLHLMSKYRTSMRLSMAKLFFASHMRGFALRLLTLLFVLVCFCWLLDRSNNTVRFESDSYSFAAQMEPPYPLFPGSFIQLNWQSEHLERLRIDRIVYPTTGILDTTVDVCQTFSF